MITAFFRERTKIISFFRSVLPAAVLMVGFAVCAAGMENAPVILEAELMTASDGSPFGIRVEIINPDKSEYLALFAPWGAAELFHVILFDERGYAVSPLPVFRPELVEIRAFKDRHLAVAPGSRRFVRLPIPGEVRLDPTGLTNGQLVPITRGKYRVLVTARGVFFKNYNASPEPGEKPDYKSFHVTKNLGWVHITPEYTEGMR